MRRRFGMEMIAAAVLAGMLAFAAFVAPEHVAAHSVHSSHDNCEICHIVRHAPLPMPDVASDIRPLLFAERAPALPATFPTLSQYVRVRLSRAPPL